MVVCRTHFLKASLVSLPHGSLHRASPSEQAVKISARKQEGKEKGTQEGHHHLLEPHPRSDTLRFSHILFFRRKSPGPAHSQEQDMTQACDCQDVGSLAVCLRSLPARPHAAATKGLACWGHSCFPCTLITVTCLCQRVDQGNKLRVTLSNNNLLLRFLVSLMICCHEIS